MGINKMNKYNWLNERCGNCANLTNVLDEERPNDDVMGGCFVSGEVTFTDIHACSKFEPFEK